MSLECTEEFFWKIMLVLIRDVYLDLLAFDYVLIKFYVLIPEVWIPGKFAYNSENKIKLFKESH